MELCRHIEKDNGGNIIWVKEGCTLDKTFQYTVKAGTFVSADKCKECSEKEHQEFVEAFNSTFSGRCIYFKQDVDREN